MARYDIDCPLCGVNEVQATPSEAVADILRCGTCGLVAPQVFSPDHFLGARIDAGGEDVSDAARVRDGSNTWNAGLPGIETRVGTRPDGKAKTEYRPITHRELGSNAGVREYAKRHGFQSAEGSSDRFRTTPR